MLYYVLLKTVFNNKKKDTFMRGGPNFKKWHEKIDFLHVSLNSIVNVIFQIKFHNFKFLKFFKKLSKLNVKCTFIN